MNNNTTTTPSCACNNEVEISTAALWKKYLPALFSFCILVGGLVLDYYKPSFFTRSYNRFVWYLIAYAPVGIPVMKEAFESLQKKEFFTEFTLMFVATLGAFAIGEYPEGVAVMLFYAIGELFQEAAVGKAKRNIKALIDLRPATAAVWRNGNYVTVNPAMIEIGEKVQIKAGEKVPLDGELLSEASSFDTAALTGESKPATIRQSETVLAGMLNLSKVVEIKVSKRFNDSALSKILDLVQNATTRKAKTELFIRKFAKIYTPLVFALAALLVIIPTLVAGLQVFDEWLYRALIFLVVSCPCALVISVPLSYFGGIGAASHHGILFKGSNFLEVMAKVNTVVMDKTGTLTRGVFRVQQVVTVDYDKQEFLKIVGAIEQNSHHPIAKAITTYLNEKISSYTATGVEELRGMGLSGIVNETKVLVGNTKLIQKSGIAYDKTIDSIVESTVVVAINNRYAGYITIADELKDDAAQTIEQLRKNGVQQTMLLSGDKDSITQKVAQQLGIDEAHGNLLPEDKLCKVEELKKYPERVIAFVGDGINDAPVLAMSDVGIAMGALGSDAAIETADVVIQTDQPSNIVTAIRIGKATRKIVIQNIAIALGFKIIVMILGAIGVATMWEAVFADVGVTLIAVLNSVRILRMKF